MKISTVTFARAAPATETAAPPVAAPAARVDALTQQQVPLRFPWLSRHSALGEAAPDRRTPFRDVPVLGVHLDAAA